MEDSSSNRIAVIQELSEGKEFAAQLDIMLQGTWSGDSKDARGLIQKVSSSITRALNALDCKEETKSADQDQGSRLICNDEGKSETRGRKRKNRAVQGGGCRKRQLASQGRTVQSKTVGDEYLWRKYGQKDIYGSKYPRSYYRCTYKYDQGCQATKQVQKSEDDPSLYLITYIGDHSCKGPTNNIICEASTISFGSNTSNIRQEAPLECDEVFSNVCSGLSSSATEDLDMSIMVDSLDFGDDAFGYEGDDFFRDLGLL